MSDTVNTVVAAVGGLIAVGLWFGVLSKTNTVISKFVDWPHIKQQVRKVIGTTMFSTFLLLCISLIYLLQDQTKSLYVVFGMCAVGASIAYSALAASAAGANMSK